jgi:hypothetical protein
MKKQYEPELGQMIFGQPTQVYDCPEYIESLLRGISSELERVMWNNKKQYNSPMDNTGEQFKNDTFEVNAYSWNDEEEQPYNFKYKDIEISWYKYLGRGMSINKPITEKQAVKMFDECIKSIRKMEKPL